MQHNCDIDSIVRMMVFNYSPQRTVYLFTSKNGIYSHTVRMYVCT